MVYLLGLPFRRLHACLFPSPSFIVFLYQSGRDLREVDLTDIVSYKGRIDISMYFILKAGSA